MGLDCIFRLNSESSLFEIIPVFIPVFVYFSKKIKIQDINSTLCDSDVTVPPYSLCTFLIKTLFLIKSVFLEAWLRITQSEKIVTYTPMWSGPHWGFPQWLVLLGSKGFPEQFEGLSHTKVELETNNRFKTSESERAFKYKPLILNSFSNFWAIEI